MVSGSARLDRHNVYGTFLMPRVSALHRPGEGWSIRASVGSGYFAPTPFTEETEAVGLARLRPLTGISVEKVVTSSMVVNHVRGPFEFNVTVFGSVLTDAIQLRTSENGELFLENAEATTRTRGTELLVRYHAQGLHVTATHTYVRADEPTPQDDGRQTVALTPSHAVGIVGMREYEGQGRLAAEFYYTGRQHLDDNPYRTVSRPYVILGLLGEWRFGPARVFLNAENLLDVRQSGFDPLVRPAQSRAGRWTVDAWAPLEGRVFNLGARIEW
jgi:iron complex outermembrane receptor protein